MTPLLPPVEEEPVEPPPPIQGSDPQDVLREHWYNIRYHVARGPVQTRYNHRLTSLDTISLNLSRIFHEQTTAFKVNVSYGFILKNKTTGRFKYYHSSCNCCGRYLEEPSMVTNAETFETFLEHIHEQDILQWSIALRPNSDWICELVTNATFFVNRILQHPVGCVGISLPSRIKCNRTIIGLEKKHMSIPYAYNLCLFRCLGLHLSHDAMTIYTQYTDRPAGEFGGVTIDDLQILEHVFGVNIVVYELGNVSAQLVRRSLRKHADTMYVNQH